MPLTRDEQIELARLMRERTEGRAGGDTPPRRWARTRERLVAAFGEADIAQAMGEQVGE